MAAPPAPFTQGGLYNYGSELLCNSHKGNIEFKASPVQGEVARRRRDGGVVCCKRTIPQVAAPPAPFTQGGLHNYGSELLCSFHKGDYSVQGLLAKDSFMFVPCQTAPDTTGCNSRHVSSAAHGCRILPQRRLAVLRSCLHFEW